MFAMRLMLAAAALLFLGVADAFVSPSTFVRVTPSISSSNVGAATSTKRAARAMRCRPTMNIIDVGSFAELDKLTKENTDKLIVVNYSRHWCDSCKMILPKFESLAEEYSEAIFVMVIGDTSIDASQLMKREGVGAVPYFHFWKGGKKVDTVYGENEEVLEETLRGFY